jgi:hypothetical protein
VAIAHAAYERQRRDGGEIRPVCVRDEAGANRIGIQCVARLTALRATANLKKERRFEISAVRTLLAASSEERARDVAGDCLRDPRD